MLDQAARPFTAYKLALDEVASLAKGLSRLAGEAADDLADGEVTSAGPHLRGLAVNISKLETALAKEALTRAKALDAADELR